jgi:hypothetical protein
MVNFAQGFLQNLANPAMSKSLFGAGAAIGNLPRQYQEQKKLEAYRSMSPLQQLEYSIANAKTPADIQRAQEAKIDFMRQESQKAINKLEVARATEKDPVLQRKYEESMAGIAAKVGLDAGGYVGRTNAEEIRQLQRQAIQDAANERDIGKKELEVATAYKYMLQSKQSPESVAIAKKKWQDAGFTQVLVDADKEALAASTRELTHNNQLSAKADRDSYLSTTSPVSELEADISNDKNIDPAIAKVLKERIDRLKGAYPDFENKETWTEAGRRQHDAEYRAINNAYYSATIDATRTASREKERIVKLRDAMSKIAAQNISKSEWSEYTNQAEAELRKENDTWAVTPVKFSDFTEQEISQRAMAIVVRLKQEQTLSAVNAARVSQNLEALTLEEVLGTTVPTNNEYTRGRFTITEEGD